MKFQEMSAMFGRSLSFCVFALMSLGAFAQGFQPCGSLENAYGPFDYRTQRDKLKIVEEAHFLPFVENLTRGNTSSGPGGDIDYTLRASPNHHRALMAMMNLARKEKKDQPWGAQYSITCYFDRAQRFAPDDGMVKALLGIYLLRQGDRSKAVEKLEEAAKLNPGDGNVQYNLGLAYVQIGSYDKALESAHRAYAAGFPLPGLREKLKRAGKWRDAPAP